MDNIECLLSIAVPGDQNLVSKTAKILQLNLLRHGIEFTKVDSMAGWYNLNQSWYEFRAPVTTSWGPVRVEIPELMEFLEDYLSQGLLIMQVHYIVDGEYKRHF